MINQPQRKVFVKKTYQERLEDLLNFHKIFSPAYKKPEITSIRSNKREIIVGINTAGMAGSGDYKALLDTRAVD